MCGIAGVYNSSKDSDELNYLGRKFVKLLHHRGPDGNGIEVFDCNNASRTCLTHNRLSIIDLSNKARQPMSKYKSRYWISFNGEIYNYKEIKRELQKKGENFFSDSDTEVILASYKVWGGKCFEKFIGMWSIAIFDKFENTLVLCRDRMGIKPLYYAIVNNEVIFGSEPKVIISYSDYFRKLNHHSLNDYFSYRFPLGDKSFYKKIKTIKPGYFIKFNTKDHMEYNYWELPVAIKKRDEGQEKTFLDIYELLNSSVKYRMISDVPFGAFLSGGLDSSIIVYEMSKLTDERLRTYNIGFNEERYNEFLFANEVSNQFQTDHKQVTMTSNEYFDSLSTIINYKDGPLSVPNEIAIHSLSKELKKNISVVLSGEGADELFGGYGRIFRSAYDFLRVKEKGLENLSHTLKKNILSKYNENDFSSELNFFLNQYSYINPNSKKSLFNDDFFEKINEDIFNKDFFEVEWKKLNGLDLHEKFMYIFQKIHLQGLLGRLDCATMSSSVEGRVPFTDHRLVEYVNQIPLKYKLQFKKELSKIYQELNSDQISERYDITKFSLREIYKDKLPNNIINRFKVGFPVPLDEWVSISKDNIMDKLFSSNSKTKNIFDNNFIKKAINKEIEIKNSGLLVWMILNVEEWMQNYKVSLE